MKLYSGLAWGIAEHHTLPRAFWAHLFAHRDLDDPRVIVPRHLPGDRAHLQYEAPPLRRVVLTKGPDGTRWVGALVAVSDPEVARAENCGLFDRIGAAKNHAEIYQKEILDAKERWEIFRHWCAHRAEFNLSGGDLLLIAGEA